jgi:hypothetical protein
VVGFERAGDAGFFIAKRDADADGAVVDAGQTLSGLEGRHSMR